MRKRNWFEKFVASFKNVFLVKQKPLEETLLKAIEINPLLFEKVYVPSKDVQLKAVSKDGLLIRYIEDPIEEVQLAAIKQNIQALKHIEKPTINVLKSGIEISHRAIKNIENPTEELIKLAINKYPYSVLYLGMDNLSDEIRRLLPDDLKDVKKTNEFEFTNEFILNNCEIEPVWFFTNENPSKEVQLKAIDVLTEEELYSYYSYIKQPIKELTISVLEYAYIKENVFELYEGELTEEDVLTILRVKPMLIRCIEYPNEKMVEAAINSDPHVVKYVSGLPEEYILMALEKDAQVLFDINNPTDKMIETAFKTDWRIYKYIVNPTEEMTKTFILNNDEGRVLDNKEGLALEYIKNPTEEMKMMALEKRGENIIYIENPTDSIKEFALKQLLFKFDFAEYFVYCQVNDVMSKMTNDMAKTLGEIKCKKEQKNESCIISDDFDSEDEPFNSTDIFKETTVSKTIKHIASRNCSMEQVINGIRDYIRGLSKKEIVELVKVNGSLLALLEKPDEELCLLAVAQNPNVIHFINNPSNKCMVKALEKDGFTLFDLKNPTNELKLIAIKQNPNVVKNIKNPTEEMLIEAIKQDSEYIKLVTLLSEPILKAFIESASK